MKQVKVFGKTGEKNKVLGLEIPDFLFLGFLYLLIFLVSKHLILNAVLILSSYFFLALYKRGKPRHWTGSVIRFLLRPRSYRFGTETEKEIFKS